MLKAAASSFKSGLSSPAPMLQPKRVASKVGESVYALLFSPADWRHGLTAFVLFRLFDMTKPFPIRRLERLPGGWGIVFDDVAAGLYALAIASLLGIWF